MTRCAPMGALVNGCSAIIGVAGVSSTVQPTADSVQRIRQIAGREWCNRLAPSGRHAMGIALYICETFGVFPNSDLPSSCTEVEIQFASW